MKITGKIILWVVASIAGMIIVQNGFTSGDVGWFDLFYSFASDITKP